MEILELKNIKIKSFVVEFNCSMEAIGNRIGRQKNRKVQIVQLEQERENTIKTSEQNLKDLGYYNFKKLIFMSKCWGECCVFS